MERSKRVTQAEEWMKQVRLPVVIYWIDNAEIGVKMDTLYGQGTAATLKPEKFHGRGAVRVLSGAQPDWVAGLAPDMMDAVRAIEERQNQQYFEKCSFENSAKGNLIYETLDIPGSAAHGVMIS